LEAIPSFSWNSSILEVAQPKDGVAQDQQRPALANDFERSSDRADLVWIVALKQDLIVAELLDKSQPDTVGSLA
jgi:hypothetical protein